jgi:hypothetical protein
MPASWPLQAPSHELDSIDLHASHDRGVTRRAFAKYTASMATVPLVVGMTRVPEAQQAMGTLQDNKTIVGRWFTEFWGNPWNPKVIDDLAAPDMLLQYSLHAPRKGREDVRAFITGFRSAFPDLGFSGTADLIAEGDYVVGPLDWRRHSHGSCLQRLPRRIVARRLGAQDALRRHDRDQGREWEDRRRDRAR